MSLLPSDDHSGESALSADCNGGCDWTGECGDRDRGIHPGEGSEGDIAGDYRKDEEAPPVRSGRRRDPGHTARCRKASHSLKDQV